MQRQKILCLQAFQILRLMITIPQNIHGIILPTQMNISKHLEKVINLIKPNSLAPEWQLPLDMGNNIVKLCQLKGKVVLLEFWIKNCGHCIEAVADLNSIAKKYKNKKFEVLGVNAHDTKEDISNFYEKNKPNFKTVYDEEVVVSEYGVYSFPTIILLGKNGKVLYSGEFDKS